MLLTLDVGNTNIKIGLFDGEELCRYWRLSTTRRYTSDEMGVMMTHLFNQADLAPRCVDGIALSSVVPTMNFTVEHMCRDTFGITPMTVGPGVRTGMDIRYDNPHELGSDRICNAVAAPASALTSGPPPPSARSTGTGRSWAAASPPASS